MLREKQLVDSPKVPDELQLGELQPGGSNTLVALLLVVEHIFKALACLTASPARNLNR